MDVENKTIKKQLLPANMTIPKHHSVFLSTQPRRSIFSLSRGYLLPFQYNVPVNLSSLLFGGSQMTSPEEQRKKKKKIRQPWLIKPSQIIRYK